MIKDLIKEMLATGTMDERGVVSGVKFNDVIKVVCTESISLGEKKKYIDQYKLKHDILDPFLRPDREVKKNGQLIRTEKVARIVLPYQKKIVEYAVAFLFGNPIAMTAKERKKLNQFKEVWDDLKMDNLLREFSRRIFIETEAAILFYPDFKTEETKDGVGIIVQTIREKKLRAKILCYEKGDEIFAYFNDLGDLEAFTRKYELVNYQTKKPYICYDIYLDTIIVKAVRVSNNWQITLQENPVGKIPVIYCKQESSEWNDVQVIIDREELHRSKHADTNDYFGSPAVVAKGEIENPPEKNDGAKFYKMVGVENPQTGKLEYGDIDYLTYSKDTESVKLEHDLNHEAIHSFTNTPNVTLDTLRSLGNTSGIALKIMFYDAIMKSQNKQEIFEPSIQRTINLLKEMIRVFLGESVDAKINFKFSDPLPSNIEELVNILTLATGGNKPIISQESAVMLNPLVEDKSAELVKIEKENSVDEAKQNNIEDSFNLN